MKTNQNNHKRTFPKLLLSFMLAMSSSLVLCPNSLRARGGVPLWTNRCGGTITAMAVDKMGNIFLTGNSNSGYSFTMKYSNEGVTLWTKLYNGAADGALAVDPAGNAFVTGASMASNGSADYVTLKYSSSGVPLWTNLFDGPGNGSDYGRAIAVDANGNVFVTGASDAGGFNNDFATIKYSNAGTPLWTNYYDGPAGLTDLPRAMVVDSGGNVIVTGVSFNSLNPHDTDYATIKYSGAGDLVWINYYDGPDDLTGNSADEPWGVAVDNNDNVFVTGISGAANGYVDYATVAYSSAGVALWTNRYNGPANSGDDAQAIAVDDSGNVFVTGCSVSASGSDFATIKYSSAGAPLWTRRYNGPGNSSDSAAAITVDRAGNVFVTGDSGNGNAAIGYSSAGVPLWTNRFDGGGNAIALDRYGNVFVAGTIKYSSSIPLPLLNFQKLNNQLVLSWTNAGFNLQSAPSLTGTFTNVPGATSPYTNSFTAPRQFFRLIAN